MIYIRTNANNAEHTLRRTIESVLNQTCSSFMYYINDNGSTDGTRKIIEEYAGIDSRIVPFYNKVNRVYEDEYIRKNFCELTEKIKDDDYLCYLDADDEYYPTFLEDILQFMKDNKLDIGCCGSEMLSVRQGNAVVAMRNVNSDVILQGRDFETMFPYYHQFARAVWGKLYRGSTLRERVCYNDPTNRSYPSYGCDTVETLRAFSKANRVGICEKVLHKYYISEKSDSYRLDPLRVVSDSLQHNFTIEYLKKFGPVSKKNMDFLYAVYGNAIKDTIDVVLSSSGSDTTKLQALADILSCPITKEMLECENVDENLKQSVLFRIAEWVLKYRNNTLQRVEVITFLCAYALRDIVVEPQENFYSAFIEKTPKLLRPIMYADLTAALKCINTSYKGLKTAIAELDVLEIFLMKNLSKKKSEIFERCSAFIGMFPESKYIHRIENLAEAMMETNSLLKDISISAAVEFSSIICMILDDSSDAALEKAIEIADGGRLTNAYAKQFYCLGQNLACVAGCQEAFLYFKKLTILLLIDNELIDEARVELSDFDRLLPDDEDFRWFRSMI